MIFEVSRNMSSMNYGKLSHHHRTTYEKATPDNAFADCRLHGMELTELLSAEGSFSSHSTESEQLPIGTKEAIFGDV